MFEKLYDDLQKDVNYEALLRPLLPYLDKSKLIMDAGSGSGYIMAYLLSHGYKVFGVDINPTMLMLAKNRLESLGLQAELYEHDLRKPIEIKVDQIICLLDVFHYFKGIKTVAKNFYNALNDGGIVILDLYKAPINEVEDADDEIVYHWQVTTNQHRIEHRLTVYDGLYKGNYEINQYYYSVEYYINTLKNIGFDVSLIEGFDDRKIYVVCRKIK